MKSWFRSVIRYQRFMGDFIEKAYERFTADTHEEDGISIRHCPSESATQKERKKRRKEGWNKSNRIQTIDAFSCILVLLLVPIIVFLLVVLYYYYFNVIWIVSQYRFILLTIDILLEIGVFSWFQLVCGRRTDQRPDGRTDQPMDGLTDQSMDRQSGS